MIIKNGKYGKFYMVKKQKTNINNVYILICSVTVILVELTILEN